VQTFRIDKQAAENSDHVTLIPHAGEGSALF